MNSNSKTAKETLLIDLLVKTFEYDIVQLYIAVKAQK